jgi:MFS family permease
LPPGGATPLRIRRVQKITLTLLFIAGIVNFLDRSSLSVAGEAIRADLGLSATEFGVLLSAFSLSYGFAQLPSGILLDRLGTADCAGRRADFLVRDAGPDRDGQFVLAFYSAAHWPRDRRSAVYARRREIDQRLVCAKRARHGGGDI